MGACLCHYTDVSGWKAISSQREWLFKASQPPRPDAHPYGAYFTSLPPTTRNLPKLLRMPRRKTEFFFSFVDAGDLRALPGGRGEFILYCPVDYAVPEARQRQHGPVSQPQEESL